MVRDTKKQLGDLHVHIGSVRGGVLRLGDSVEARVDPARRAAIRAAVRSAAAGDVVLLAGKGQSLRAIAKALTRSEDSVKDRARQDGLKIAKLH